MSIWTSGPGECTAANIDDPQTDIYRGTGPLTVEIDVATATPWHDNYRLQAFEIVSKPGGVDLDLILDRDNLEQLRAQIDWALSQGRNG